MWAITYPGNNVGKTSCLEFAVWPLRGAPRQLPDDVRTWIHRIEADIRTGHRALRIVLDTVDPRRPRCTIRACPTLEQLDDLPDNDQRLVGSVQGQSNVSALIDDVMRGDLGLEPTMMWGEKAGQDGEGAAQTYGWASYFGALYLNLGGANLLFGDVATAGLPGQLLELFIDVPYTATLSRIEVAIEQRLKQDRLTRRRAEEAARARSSERAQWDKEARALRRKAATMRRQDPVAELAARRTQQQEATQQWKAAIRQVERATEAAELAKEARIEAKRLHLDAVETHRARKVMGLAEIDCCGRCQRDLGPERKKNELTDGICRSCTRPLPETDTADPHAAEAELADLAGLLARAEEDEKQVAKALRLARDREYRARKSCTKAGQLVEQTADASQIHAQLTETEQALARLEGKLEATSPQPASSLQHGPDTAVLQAVAAQLTRCVEQSGSALFAALDQEIRDLSARFGVANLDSVHLHRTGVITAVKAGVRMRFVKLTPGDRLRMRIATVIALLRIGGRRGTIGHPGLLLVDSIGTAETTVEDGRRLVRELAAVAQEMPGLQVILTTAQPDMVSGILPTNQVITSSQANLF
ncbi:hypothetical protein NX794_31505 [Streptomyces sp. LP11]|uniref:Large ATP-binding protein n=1 Tax=Streptomyces pyxinicus TaxID=2970331 RepID=A0ABT2BB09_9ACTN|nr:hypothetical protein [Streptomyces sp. LP11]MCS0605695.1 hypothetical protein [Streptomyces sp. LP11]